MLNFKCFANRLSEASRRQVGVNTEASRTLDLLRIYKSSKKKVRIVWDAEQEKYYFSVVDVVQVLTDSFDYQQARKYWKVLKGRLIKEGNESVTNCYQLKLPSSDGKKYKTDVADLQGIFRIIQSIPSKKAEPVKQWLAQLGEQRIDQMIDPELTFQMAVEDYRRQGYSDIFLQKNALTFAYVNYYPYLCSVFHASKDGQYTDDIREIYG